MVLAEAHHFRVHPHLRLLRCTFYPQKKKGMQKWYDEHPPYHILLYDATPGLRTILLTMSTTSQTGATLVVEAA